MYQVTPLRTGLTVATAEMPHMASVSLGLWVGVGGRYEPAELNGVSHFIEHLLFKGTRKRSAKGISQAVEGIGGYLNAFTGEESTCFYSKARHDRFEGLLDVLTDMFVNSKFDPADVEKERGVIKEELAMYLDQPQHLVHEILNETLWPDQPLGRPLTGTEKSLDGLGRADLIRFQRSNYVTPCTLVAAAGNVRHRHVVKTVARLARRFPLGKRPPYSPANCDQRQPVVRLRTKQTEQTQLAMGIRTCSRHDERRFALRLLNTLLGENMSSRLFQVVREDRGLAYSIYSSLGFFDDVGTMTIGAGLDVDNLPQTLKLIVREMRRLRDDLAAPAEMRRTRDYVLGQLDLSLESTDNQMMWMGEQLIGYGKIIPPAEIKQRLAAVKPSEIRAVARDFFQPERVNLALVSPLKSDRGLLRLLTL
ncbi:MAG: insulinase family protein [Verrucomicrobia bacterium]|nr:insulinase family protein [Verrucomicrobiota bacterium]